MKLIPIIVILLFLSFIQTYGQDWIPEFLNGNWDKVDSLVDVIGYEMKREVGNDAPQYVFQDIENDSIRNLAAYKGNVLIVNFWSTNCSGCRMQIPELSKLQKQYYDDGIRVIFISPDNKDSLYKYYRKYPTEGIKTIIEVAEIKKLKRPYQFFAKPTAFLVDKNGIVRDAWIGPEKFEVLEKRILQFVSKK